jgi:hypothetical protein
MRDPAYHYSYNLAFVSFFSTEHAQHALQCYRDATAAQRERPSGDVAPPSAAFANDKAMQRLKREVSVPVYLVVFTFFFAFAYSGIS